MVNCVPHCHVWLINIQGGLQIFMATMQRWRLASKAQHLSCPHDKVHDTTQHASCSTGECERVAGRAQIEWGTGSGLMYTAQQHSEADDLSHKREARGRHTSLAPRWRSSESWYTSPNMVTRALASPDHPGICVHSVIRVSGCGDSCQHNRVRSHRLTDEGLLHHAWQVTPSWAAKGCAERLTTIPNGES